jgi:hypothetical protein
MMRHTTGTLLAAEPIDLVAPPAIAVRASGAARPVLWAPNVPAGTWAGSSLPVTVVLGGAPSRDAGDAAAAELDVALRTWSRVRCTSYRARYGGRSAIAKGADDGVNVVLFHDDAWPAELDPSAVAQTVVTIDATGHVRDADLHLNGRDFRFSLDGASGTIDLRGVLVHELGHALGLGHSTDPRATMFATGSGLRWRSLEKDDVDGVCALYPANGAPPAPSCDVDPCPSGFVCVAGACQRLGERRDVCAPCERVPGACEAAGDDARCIDVGDGGAAGRVCGRACASDEDCGAGFRCKPTSAAGDLQCVSDDGCARAASPCATDADCKDSLCRGGSCKGPADAPPADAGAGASRDAGDAAPVDPGGGGCGCRAVGPAGASGGLAIAVAAALAVLRVRTRRR